MTEYERVTYRPDDLAKGTRTIYLQNPMLIAGPVTGTLLCGVEVDREGVQVGTLTVAKRIQAISTDLVTRRTVMVMDNLTGLLTVSRDLP